jgi:hypothetical protein
MRAATARAAADKLGVDPLVCMLQWLHRGFYDEPAVDENGVMCVPMRMVRRIVAFADKAQFAQTLAQYLYPKLAALAVTGRDGGPIETSSISAKILMTPELADAMQKIAFAQAEAEAEAKTIDHAPNE